MISITGRYGIFRHRRAFGWSAGDQCDAGDRATYQSAGAGADANSAEAGQALVMRAIYTLKRGIKTAAQKRCCCRKS